MFFAQSNTNKGATTISQTKKSWTHISQMAKKYDSHQELPDKRGLKDLTKEAS